MSNKKNDIIYTAADIEKYHKGLLSPKQMHALEKAAWDDPFLADALEGYAVRGVNLPTDITDLEKRLAARTAEENKAIPITAKMPSSFNWWKAAAMTVLIAGAGLIVYQFGFNRKSSDIAETVQKETANPQDTKSDTNSTIVPGRDTDKASRLAAEETKDKTSDKDIKSSDSGLVKQQSSHDNNITQLNKDKEEPPVKKESPARSIPTLATAKVKEETFGDPTPKEKINSEKEAETARERQDEPVFNANSNQQKRAAASQRDTEGFYKVQPLSTFKQPNVFRGRVTDGQNNALPFSNITSTQDSVGTYADANGYFNLVSPDSVLKVRVSSIGFETTQVQLQNNVPSNNVLLKEDRTSLAEVVLSSKKINSNRLKNNTLVLEEPEPADGWVNYDLYLANNLKDPGELKVKPSGSQGEVELSFEVNKNGEPVNITVKKSLCDACDKEAVRLLKEGPKWTKKGKKSKATITVGF